MTVETHLESDTSTVSVHRRAQCRFSDDHAVESQPAAGDHLGETPSTRQPSDLLGHRADQHHRRTRPATVAPDGGERLEHERERGLRVDRTAAEHATVGDAAVEGVDRHVVDGDGVEVHVDHQHVGAFSGERGDEVRAPVEHVVEFDVPAEVGSAARKVLGESPLAGDRGVTALERIDARDPDEFGHRLGQSVRVRHG